MVTQEYEKLRTSSYFSERTTLYKKTSVHSIESALLEKPKASPYTILYINPDTVETNINDELIKRRNNLLSRMHASIS